MDDNESARQRWLQGWRLGLSVSGVVLLAYLGTLAPTVYTLDSAEIAAAAYSFGIPHSPGYTLHLFLLHIFQWLPLGDIGYRSNLFSAVCSALTAGLLAVFLAVQTQRWWIGALLACVYGWAYYTWSLSVVAEVYTLQVLLLGLLLLLLWQWRATLRTRYAMASALLLGLLLVNNPATGLWWPGLLVLGLPSLWQHPRRWRVAGLSLGMLLLALLLVLYLPLRSAFDPPFVNIGTYGPTGRFEPFDLSTWRDLRWYLSGGQFENLFFAYPLREIGQQILLFVYRLWGGFLGLGLPLGLWGIWQLWRRDHVTTLGWLLILIPHSIFFIGYQVPDKETMFLPVYFIWAIFCGFGVAAVVPQLPQSLRWAWGLWPAALLLINWSYCDVSDQWQYAAVAEARLQHAAPHAVYIARWGDAELMRYKQVVERQRSDINIVNAFFVSADGLHRLVQWSLDHRLEVYTAEPEPVLLQHYVLEEYNHGWRIGSREPDSEVRLR